MTVPFFRWDVSPWSAGHSSEGNQRHPQRPQQQWARVSVCFQRETSRAPAWQHISGGFKGWQRSTGGCLICSRTDVCINTWSSLCKAVDYLKSTVSRFVMKSASLVHIVLFVMYFWQGFNKNGLIRWAVLALDKTQYHQCKGGWR